MSDVPASRVKSLPALLGETDVVKTLQRLPGVTGGTEGMSGLFVRGGDGDDNLFLLDGNPVYHTDHVLGFFSAFNPDAVKNATFYKGSFPAEYGGRLSSVVDVRTNEGNRKEYHGNISIGLLAARANLEADHQGSVFVQRVGTAYLDGIDYLATHDGSEQEGRY